MAGNLCHFDIPSRNPEKAGEFYGKLFGWEIDSKSYPGYYMFKASKPPHGGIEKPEPFAAGVVIYIEVDDVIATLNKAKAAGASIVKEKTEIPGIGYFGLFSDPDGNIIGVYEGK